MTSAFIINLDVDSIDSQSLSNVAEEIHTALDGEFEVVDVKPWSRPSESTTSFQQPTMPNTGV